MNAEEETAFAFHVLLAGGHAISAFWNYRKAGTVDGWTLFHSAATVLDLIAVRAHYKRMKEGR